MNTSIDLKEAMYLDGATSAMYTFPVRRPLENPASSLDPRRQYTESGLLTTRSQETNPGTPAAIRIFFGPNSC